MKTTPGKAAFIIIALVVAFATFSLVWPPLREQIQHPTPQPTVSIESSILNSAARYVKRFTDAEAGVVCWVYQAPHGNGAGISCLPIAETLLSENATNSSSSGQVTAP